jgi:Holliday junction resolvase RusA-like endonuclease
VSALAFTVPGSPVPKERPRVVRGRTFTPKRTATYETLVGLHAMQATARFKKATGAAWNRSARYAVTLIVFCQDRRSRDLDNLAKSICDGCIGAAGIWTDDALIDELLVIRGRVDKILPRVVISVRQVDSNYAAGVARMLEVA